MNYIELKISINPDNPVEGEIIIAWLAGLPFDSFIDDDLLINAYMPQHLFNIGVVQETLKAYKEEGCILSMDNKVIQDENWNIKWVQNFQPIEIVDECIVYAPFHKIDKKYTYEIVIEPKMSFGTGHHETTSLMLEQMLKTHFEGKEVLDMGCGTGLPYLHL